MAATLSHLGTRGHDALCSLLTCSSGFYDDSSNPRRLEGYSEGPGRVLPPDEIALRIFGCALLLSSSALCSGLTLGVMGCVR